MSNQIQKCTDGWETKPDGWETMLKLYQTNIDGSSNFYNKIAFYKKDKPNIDGIFVLAGGINKSGMCHNFVIDRLNTAYDVYIYHNMKSPIFCIGGGSYHTPPIINTSNFVIHESTSCAEYLINRGVNAKHIYKEYASYDTIANGYYSFTNYIIPLQLSSIVLITTEFHMTRTKTIFEWMKQLFQYKINISYIATTNNSMEDNVLAIRQQRENNSVTHLKTTIIPKYNTLHDFHRWFYTEHKAYCADSEITRKEDIKDILLKQTY